MVMRILGLGSPMNIFERSFSREEAEISGSIVPSPNIY